MKKNVIVLIFRMVVRYFFLSHIRFGFNGFDIRYISGAGLLQREWEAFTPTVNDLIKVQGVTHRFFFGVIYFQGCILSGVYSFRGVYFQGCIFSGVYILRGVYFKGCIF